MRTILLSRQLMDRRQFLLGTVASAGLACRRASEREPLPAAERTAEINRLFARRHEQRLFDGEALVAEGGIVVYRGAFGLADRDAKRPYTTDTPSCVASLSKPFTAVAVMMLAEQRLVTFESQLSQLLPGFSAAIGAVTVRQLLTHTSACPTIPISASIDRA
jgi:CubicO group peptidase (beta-lactamase class C family)